MTKWWRFLPLGVFVLVVAVFFVQLGKNSQYVPSALIGQPLPDFKLVDLYEETIVAKEQLPKPPYIINFWGTWCPACHVEHPFLVTLAGRGVAIIGIDYKDQQAAAQQWLAEKSNPYQLVLMDEVGHFGLDMGVTGAPESFVVNAEGIIAYRHQGVINESNWPTIKAYLNE